MSDDRSQMWKEAMVIMDKTTLERLFKKRARAEVRLRLITASDVFGEDDVSRAAAYVHELDCKIALKEARLAAEATDDLVKIAKKYGVAV